MNESLADVSPDAVAAALGRNEGGFGREQRSYYDLPVLHRAHWDWEIVTYFWVGGIMSGSALLAVLADLHGAEADRALVRSGRFLALVGAAASGTLLVKDLKRPERFLNMLRVLKLGSPMSVGSWGLVWFTTSAALVVSDQLVRDAVLPFDPAGFLPLPLRHGSLAAASALMASYTGVLISATAIPVWYHGRRFIPAIFVASAASTACAANAALLALWRAGGRTQRKLERLETLAAALELALLFVYERRVGRDARALFHGDVGRTLKRATVVGGLLMPLVRNLPAWFARDEPKAPSGRERLMTLAVSGLALYGGYALRRSFIQAGRASADDPKPVLRRPSGGAGSAV